jgi:hypothetical protein
MALAIILYPIATILAAVSIILKKVSPVAGIAGILTGLLWIFGVDSLKATIIQEAGRQGAFSQLFASMFASAISIGYGAFIPIIGGILLLTTLPLNRAEPKHVK